MADTLVTQDLVLQTATALDTAILQGSGIGAVPEGIYSNSDVDEEDGATAGQPSFAELLNMWTAVSSANALRGNLAWIGTPAVIAHCLQTDKGTDTGSWLADTRDDGFSINSYRAMVSNNLPANGLIFGNWAEVLLAEWNVGELLVDPYTGANKGDVAIRFIHEVDVALRHGASFSRLKLTA